MSLLQGALITLDICDQLIIILPQDCVNDCIGHTLPIDAVSSSLLGIPAGSYLWIVSKQDFFSKLTVRHARLEDLDDIVPILRNRPIELLTESLQHSTSVSTESENLAVQVLSLPDVDPENSSQNLVREQLLT